MHRARPLPPGPATHARLESVDRHANHDHKLVVVQKWGQRRGHILRGGAVHAVTLGDAVLVLARAAVLAINLETGLGLVGLEGALGASAAGGAVGSC